VTLLLVVAALAGIDASGRRALRRTIQLDPLAVLALPEGVAGALEIPFGTRIFFIVVFEEEAAGTKKSNDCDRRYGRSGDGAIHTFLPFHGAVIG
jgi:hypothetical protein